MLYRGLNVVSESVIYTTYVVGKLVVYIIGRCTCR